MKIDEVVFVFGEKRKMLAVCRNFTNHLAFARFCALKFFCFEKRKKADSLKLPSRANQPNLFF